MPEGYTKLPFDLAKSNEAHKATYLVYKKKAPSADDRPLADMRVLFSEDVMGKATATQMYSESEIACTAYHGCDVDRFAVATC